MNYSESVSTDLLFTPSTVGVLRAMVALGKKSRPACCGFQLGARALHMPGGHAPLCRAPPAFLDSLQEGRGVWGMGSIVQEKPPLSWGSENPGSEDLPGTQD